MRQGEADDAAVIRNEGLLIIARLEIDGHARGRLGHDGQAVVVEIVHLQPGLCDRAGDDERAFQGDAAGRIADILRADLGIGARRARQLGGEFAVCIRVDDGAAAVRHGGNHHGLVRLRRAADGELIFARRYAADGDLHVFFGDVQVVDHRRRNAGLRGRVVDGNAVRARREVFKADLAHARRNRAGILRLAVLHQRGHHAHRAGRRHIHVDALHARRRRRGDGLCILRNRQAADRAFQCGVRMTVICHGDSILPCRKVGKFREGRIGFDGLGARPADERHHQRLGLNLHFARRRVIGVIARIRHLHADLLAVHRRIGHDLAIGVFVRLRQRVFVVNRHRTAERRGVRCAGISNLHSVHACLQPAERHVGRAAEQRLFLFGHRSVFVGQSDGDFPIAAAGDFNIQLEVAVIQLDVKLLILLGRGGRVFRSLRSYRSCRGYRSHRTSAAGCGASALITTGCGAAFTAGRAAFTRLNQFNARRFAGLTALIRRLHRQRNFLLSPLVARCFRILRDGNVVPAFLHGHLHSGLAACVKRRFLFIDAILCFRKQLHHNAFARRAGQRDGNHTVIRRELHSDFFAAHRLLRLVFLQRRSLRLARRGLGLRQRKRRGRRKEHAYAQHHRNFTFHFISIHPDSLHDEKSLRVSAPSYHVSSLYATDRAAMRPLHTERTSAAISSHLAEIFY